MDKFRKIAVIISIDIAGFSKASEFDDLKTASLVRSFKTILNNTIQPFNGRIFNTAGDGFMVEMPTATTAVQAIHNLFSNPDIPTIRVGVHAGEVIEEENGDLLGHAVNVAARLQSLASPGGGFI